MEDPEGFLQNEIEDQGWSPSACRTCRGLGYVGVDAAEDDDRCPDCTSWEPAPVPYGNGSSEFGPCEDCWKVPSRHCCLWNEPADSGAVTEPRLLDLVATTIAQSCGMDTETRPFNVVLVAKDVLDAVLDALAPLAEYEQDLPDSSAADRDAPASPLGTPQAGEEAPSEEPVYIDGPSPQFFATADEAAESWWDRGADPTTVIAHPCTVRPCGTPDLREYVEEAWACEYDDPDAVSWEPTPRALEALTVCQAVLEEEAPMVWVPRLKERVTLPAIDCPDCGRASNEPWDELHPDCAYYGRPNEADASAGVVARPAAPPAQPECKNAEWRRQDEYASPEEHCWCWVNVEEACCICGDDSEGEAASIRCPAPPAVSPTPPTETETER